MLSKTPYIKLDKILIFCYLLLVVIGCTNIYASICGDGYTNPFSLDTRSGTQILWAGLGILIAAAIIFLITPNLYISTCWLFYAATTLLLIAVLILGREINGSKSWLILGPVSFQPSEISKISTSLALALTMSKSTFRLSHPQDRIRAILVILLPILLIALEPDFGTILVYIGFIFVFYREGLSGWYIIFGLILISLFIITLRFSPFAAILSSLGISGILYGIFTERSFRSIVFTALFITATAFLPWLMETETFSFLNILSPSVWLTLLCIPYIIFAYIKTQRKKLREIQVLIAAFACSLMIIFSVDFIYDHLLKEHHRDRIENLLGMTDDPYGIGYNVNQSMIAIGSGGFSGKGFLQGTQTKFNFVPEQSTDFIFCTIGEEWGFLGSLLLLATYFTMMVRIILLAEKQKQAFTRIYGYCVASCLFIHVIVNIGMTIGLMPVVGIPLPWVSYGGSSFVTFTVLLFIFIRLDLERWK